MVKNFPPISTRPPTAVYGQVLLNEVMADPPGDQPDQEWFEIYNDGGSVVDLSGYRIGDEENPDGNEGLMEFPQGSLIYPGQVIVIANKAVSFDAMFGFKPDFEIYETDPHVPNLFKCASGCRTTISLTNDNDEVLLYDTVGDVVDALAWGSSFWEGFQPSVKSAGKGRSLERYPAYQDGDSAQDWREQSVPAPAAPEGASLERFPPYGDTGSASDWRVQLVPAPGQVDFSPTPTQLLFHIWSSTKSTPIHIRHWGMQIKMG